MADLNDQNHDDRMQSFEIPHLPAALQGVMARPLLFKGWLGESVAKQVDFETILED